MQKLNEMPKIVRIEFCLSMAMLAPLLELYAINKWLSFWDFEIVSALWYVKALFVITIIGQFFTSALCSSVMRVCLPKSYTRHAILMVVIFVLCLLVLFQFLKHEVDGITANQKYILSNAAYWILNVWFITAAYTYKTVWDYIRDLMEGLAKLISGTIKMQ